MSHKIAWAIPAALLTTTAAWAGALYEAPLSSCGSINCAGMTIRGIHQDSEPFVIQVFARTGECLRLDVSTQTEDVAMLLSSPTVNAAAVNDDRDLAGGDLRPLIAVDDLTGTGWYTVAVSYFNFDDEEPAPIIARFTLEYGRYPAGNINCAEAVTTARTFKRPSESLAKPFGPAVSGLEIEQRQ